MKTLITLLGFAPCVLSFAERRAIVKQIWQRYGYQRRAPRPKQPISYTVNHLLYEHR